MKSWIVPALCIGALVVGCGSAFTSAPDSSSSSSSTSGSSSGSSSSCSGTAPLICNGCCGAKYAADQCTNGVWMCPLLGIACIQCDAGGSDGAPGDASADGASCTGPAPLICTGCCGSVYAADTCNSGVWACLPRAVACPSCTVDAGSKDASSCTGSAPACFGNDTSACCGQDPSGIATCHGNTWMCGAVTAPGCNGVSCLLKDAGPG